MATNSFDALLIDAGTGNLRSVHNALLKLGYTIQVTARAEDLARPARIILPGVGAFGSFMQGLRERGLIEPIQAAARRGDHLLGICVGMQALFELSEEQGQHAGLGLLPGKVTRFPNFPDRKVPHTGWNQLWFREGAALFRGLPPGAYAYFNHSYYCAAADPSDTAAGQGFTAAGQGFTAAYTDYGIDFPSAVQRENISGVQFHPEKSQRVGLTVLENFFKAS